MWTDFNIIHNGCILFSYAGSVPVSDATADVLTADEDTSA